ncbi:hypothetical protein B7P43_G18260 [Cryptotermes secundus]|uniref:Uncharacterized protein n=1 Tax=Cryptotermes secundus TaxID=105785 RepID=A0A2J7PPG5_9NEOP|nr:hypothetical protein B7P43_G18260 [Cryptotermes secundus]
MMPVVCSWPFMWMMGKSIPDKTTNPKVYLGIQIEKQPDGIHISKTNYASQMLEK